jgi:hypothetical protein
MPTISRAFAKTSAETAHESRVREVSKRIQQRPPHKIIRIQKRGNHSIHACVDKSQAHQRETAAGKIPAWRLLRLFRMLQGGVK